MKQLITIFRFTILLFLYISTSLDSFSQSKEANTSGSSLPEKLQTTLQDVFGKLKPLNGKLILTDTNTEDFIQFTYCLQFDNCYSIG
jgi:hypothetical protein